jgi:pyridoxal phosphate enzyme (YggS family)
MAGITKDEVKKNLERVRKRIVNSAIRAGRRPEEIILVAVTKGVPVELIQGAYEEGQRIFGENYAQEAIQKIERLPEDITWHFIGRIQRNKVKYIAGRFALVHSIDSIGLCEEFQKQCNKKGLQIDVLVEVNLAGENTKGGVNKVNTLSFVKDMLKFNALKMKGLMAMPPYSENSEDSRKYFRDLRQLRDELIVNGIPDENLQILSMGMSNDFEIAIEEGATMLRIGTAIFGPRG